jgi:hypothetical protein
MAQERSLKPEDDDSSWPFASFSGAMEWAREYSIDPAGFGLRAGLLVAMRQAAQQQYGDSIENESETERLITAIFYLRQMLQRGDAQLSWLMAEARFKGVSWGSIARALEVSRQAAHKRFAPIVERRLLGIPRQREENKRLAEFAADYRLYYE